MRTSEESAVDQRPYHDRARFAIDAQQSLGLWQRDAESWHLGVLGPDPAGQISKRRGLVSGFRNYARHHEPSGGLARRPGPVGQRRGRRLQDNCNPRATTDCAVGAVFGGMSRTLDQGPLRSETNTFKMKCRIASSFARASRC